jgi:4-alpha-glucanotransferase
MGELGPQARAFGKFLSDAGQTLWQILPTGPVGYGFSPYSSLSAFAGNHLLISFDELLKEGRLTRRNLSRFPKFDPHKIDFPAVVEAREKILFRVADRFAPTRAFRAFCKEEADWLDDYALFMAIREHHGNRPWTEWPEALRDRDFQALEKARKQYAKRIRRHKALQYLFSKHWKKMRKSFHPPSPKGSGATRGLNIQLVGDIPIFVAGDSVDVWANRELFSLNPDGTPTVVAGVPPDYFSETGQRWGNPLYDWAAHRASAYAWWTKRMHRTFEMVDIVRIDHFRAFNDYWEIPAAEPTAIKGRWVKGPGLEFFQTLEKQMRKFPRFGKKFQLADHVIAEDLGEINAKVRKLRADCDFPGMTVLHFEFGEELMNKRGHRPEGRRENQTIYTGTHDNELTRTWFKQLDDGERQRVLDYLESDGAHIHRDLCELALRSPAKWAILPLQDVLGKGARMNRPGTTHGNWGWRVSADMVTTGTIEFLKEMTERNGRI